jgi:two-component system, NarL family, sensor kinase
MKYDMKGNAVLTKESLEIFDHALGLLDNSLKELTNVANCLVPETLTKFGLRQALTDYCIGFRINFASYGGDKRYDEKLEIASFLIASELIVNAKKHSDAKKIEVQLICETERLSFTIQDNGKGVDIEKIQTQEGSGLSKIRSLVSSFDGHFDVYSEHGKGTEAIVEFKIQQ